MYYSVVAEIAQEKGISIWRLEKMANLQNGTIGKWRKSNPNISSLEAVAMALNIPVEVLIQRAQKRKSEEQEK